ncbi:endonuclease V [Flindersiella endophytica]
MSSWPGSPGELLVVQRELAAAGPEAWSLPNMPDMPDNARIGGCFAAFPRGLTGEGAAGDPVWVGAVVLAGGRVVASHVASAAATAAYTPGLLALREGPALEAAVRSLAVRPDVLLVNATGRDHPRGAGLASHLGAALDLPTVGVTHRPFVATGDWPADSAGASSPLRVGDAVVGYWLRTKAGTRPLAVDAGWRTSPDTALEVVRAATGPRARTPEPIRLARHLAREARHAASGTTRDRRAARTPTACSTRTC